MLKRSLGLGMEKRVETTKPLQASGFWLTCWFLRGERGSECRRHRTRRDTNGDCAEIALPVMRDG